MNLKFSANARSLRHSGATVGALLMLASAFLFAVLDGLIKLLGPPFRIWDIAFYRFACGLAILVLIVGRRHNPFAGHNRRLLIIRGITGSCAFLALVAAIRLIPISTALVLFFSFPAFAAFFSPLFFKEPITWNLGSRNSLQHLAINYTFYTNSIPRFFQYSYIHLTLSLSPSIYLSICLSIINTFIKLTNKVFLFRLIIFFLIFLSTYQSRYILIFLTNSLSIYLSINLSSIHE